MKVVIIEDEHPNALRLQKMLLEIDDKIEIVQILESVEKSSQFIGSKPELDLIFLDVRLTDGTGLEILERTKTKIPVIFTTAFDEYAIDAFKYLSVDYLLKPIKKDALKNSLKKYYENFKHKDIFTNQLNKLVGFIQPEKPSIYICRRGKNQYPIKTDQIVCCFVEDQETWVMTKDGNEFLIQKSLEQLDKEMDSKLFFRANRKVICSKNAVEKFEILPKSKIKLKLSLDLPFEIIISSEKSAAFKEWIVSD